MYASGIFGMDISLNDPKLKKIVKVFMEFLKKKGIKMNLNTTLHITKKILKY